MFEFYAENRLREDLTEAEKSDILAIGITMDRLSRFEENGWLIKKAVQYVYLEGYPVHQAATFLTTSRTAVYNWLQKARILAAEIRGLREINKRC